ncbi:MAG: triose-phosphate isomerase [Bacteroidetes bacterium]|nr:triose-phosphate isomerase [Bacteroidota bacterium]MBS1739243.1 triose-phosphate isomerase [Bacteroidota bacterium]MBS1775542.1 triose-phosphate isomerase [Bacteroidota bacterium]
MRKRIVAGNWKMNLTLAEGKNLVEAIVAQLPALTDTREVVIAPPFTHITQTAAQLEEYAHISVGAQNCSSEAGGAFTGEVSATMLQSAGVGSVILGHSERREYFNETSELLVKKIAQAFNQNLRVIFCCGEPLSVRDANEQNNFVGKQIEEALFHLSAEEMNQIVIAYEPIWAIGTGRTATSAQAQEMHAYIRSMLQNKYGNDIAQKTSILYGGSCNAQNAAELFSCADIDGGLIGGAALKSEAFLAIISAMMSA